MKIITINTALIKEIFETLNSSLGGHVTFDGDQYALEVNNGLAKGSITGARFSDDLVYLQLDITFFTEFRMDLLSIKSTPICFVYCSKGNLSHRFGAFGPERKLKTFQTAIMASREDQANSLVFEKDKKGKFTVMMVGTQPCEENKLDSLCYKVKETFLEKNSLEEFFYLGAHNLKIAEKIEQLNGITQIGMVRSLLKEGILRIILAMEIQQYSDYLTASNDVSYLNLKEMQEIKELSDFIKSSPEEPFTIKALSKKSGLSPSKLQEGFKLIHDRTVNDYITHMRVLKAEILMRTSDLNISQIVYCIGFTSRSYFSKIFKEKFNCSPKEYKINLNPLSITA
jgi:AraC-like DNA-binding protein